MSITVTRREFLALAGASAAALGISLSDADLIERALADPAAPTVLWLQGAACTGCSVSLLNRISTTAPRTAADILISTINLRYHPNLMALAGQPAAEVVNDAYTKGGYVLAVEGGVPTAFNGATCWAWTYNGQDVTFKQAVTDLASRAAAVLAIGTCASFGGIPASGPNPTAIKSVAAATGKPTINIAGCPPHPDAMVWAIAQLVADQSIALDRNGRPTALYGGEVIHESCPYQDRETATALGQEGRCQMPLGCRGPGSHGRCPHQLFNGGRNWCMGAGAPCIGCTEPGFPGTAALYQAVYHDD